MMGALSLSTAATGLDTPQCKAGEYLWLVTAGNPTGTLMPDADMRVGTVTFQDWTDGTKTLRTASFSNVPKGNLGEAKTFERFSGGGDLGWFARRWPIENPKGLAGYDLESFKPLPPQNPAPTAAGGEYASDFASSRLIDGAAGQTLAQVVSSPRFNGQLTYVAPSAARIDFVTLALCTSALPVQADAPPVSANTPPKLNTAAAVLAQAAAAQEAAKIEQAAIDNQAQEDARLQAEIEEAERLEAERFTAEAEAQAQALAETVAEAETAALEAEEPVRPAIINPAIAQKEKTSETEPVKAAEIEKASGLLKSDIAANHLRRDMLTSGAMAASAAVNLIGNALWAMARNARLSAPTPTPVPSPLPQPTPVQVSAAAIGRDRKRKTDENVKKTPKPEAVIKAIPQIKEATPPVPAPIPVVTPQPTPNPAAAPIAITKAEPKPAPAAAPEPLPSSQSTASSIKTADKGVLIPGSKSFTCEIPNANAELRAAYAAVGRVGYPHAPHAARDAKGLGFGSAVLIAPNKVLTNQHVWQAIKDKPGIGVEFEAREGNEISEFITLEPKTVQILNGIDAAVLTLSRKLARKPIWPQDMDYAAKNINGHNIYAIGHPIEPEDSNSTIMKIGIEDAFDSTKPLWNVKRFSAGPIVSHTADVDGEILFDVPISNEINSARVVPALCHRASAIGGNSGGAIVCAQTGAFLGLHFGGQYWQDEDINYAVPGRDLRAGLAALGLTAAGVNTPSVIQKLSPDEVMSANKAVPIPVTTARLVQEPLGSLDDKPWANAPKIKPQKEAALNGDLFDDIPDPATPLNAKAQTLPEIQNKPKPETLTEYIIETSTARAEDSGPDDLTRIEGIGPKTAAALRAGGITNFKALAQGSPYDLLPLLEKAGLSRRDPTTWPAQAALAAAGDWDRLKAWQDTLHGGRELST